MTKPEKVACQNPKEICAQNRKSGLTKHTCVANVAVARELACWVWEVGRRAEGTLA